MLKYAFQHYLTCTHFFKGCHSSAVSLILAQVIYNKLYIDRLTEFEPMNKAFTFWSASIFVFKTEKKNPCAWVLKYFTIKLKQAVMIVLFNKSTSKWCT